MNTAAVQRLTHAVMIAATLAACVMAQGALAAPAAGDVNQIVHLPRVEVTGKRPQAVPQQVVHLPRVMITGKRADTAETMHARQPQSKPASDLVALR